MVELIPLITQIFWSSPFSSKIWFLSLPPDVDSTEVAQKVLFGCHRSSWTMPTQNSHTKTIVLVTFSFYFTPFILLFNVSLRYQVEVTWMSINPKAKIMKSIPIRSQMFPGPTKTWLFLTANRREKSKFLSCVGFVNCTVHRDTSFLSSIKKMKKLESFWRKRTHILRVKASKIRVKWAKVY